MRVHVRIVLAYIRVDRLSMYSFNGRQNYRRQNLARLDRNKWLRGSYTTYLLGPSPGHKCTSEHTMHTIESI